MKNKSERKSIVFDLDGVICTQTKGDYENARPVPGAVKLVNELHAKGHKIIIHTARFMGRFQNDARKVHAHGYAMTQQCLKKWGVQYDELIMGKPRADIVVDDRAIFFKPDWKLIAKDINARLKSTP
jgi:capsule biosynthesis phosphatase